MNVAEVKELFTYNAWADRRIFDALAALPTEDYMRDVKCSFGSLHGTLAHIVGAERLWLSRWRKQEGVTLLKGSEIASLAEIRKLWEEVEADRSRFLSGLKDADLQTQIVVKPSGGGAQYVHTLLQTLQHTVDHSSYHRGQIVTMLRQLGVKPPATGLIGFYRERAPAA